MRPLALILAYDLWRSVTSLTRDSHDKANRPIIVLTSPQGATAAESVCANVETSVVCVQFGSKHVLVQNSIYILYNINICIQ